MASAANHSTSRTADFERAAVGDCPRGLQRQWQCVPQPTPGWAAVSSPRHAFFPTAAGKKTLPACGAEWARERMVRYHREMRRAELLKAALELTSEEREQLADELWASLDGGTPAQVEQAWADEIERRVDEADAGQVEPIPGNDVRAAALEAVRRVRGR
jgi:putative addiction module component (TIGR02574 family)